MADAPAPRGTVRAEDVDPATLGQEGSGGKPTPEGLALLENKNIVFDDVGVSDIKAGKIDPRVIGVLTKLSQEHKITVSCMCSDHSKFTAGGSVSNHSFGRGLDIAAIDGEIVSPSSPLAREIASELSSFDPSIRPDEIGSPFAINGPGYFTDAAHMNHVHVGFKTELPADFDLPDGLAAGGAPAAPAAAADLGRAGRARRRRRCPRASPASSPPSPSPPAERASSPRPPPRRRPEAACVGSGVFAVPEQQPARRGRPGRGGGRRRRRRPAAPPPIPATTRPRSQIAAWMAREAEKRGLPGRLPVMAALVESNLTNVDFGDADSLGYFQMRVSIWESRYPGFADDPEKQIDWFLDTGRRRSRPSASPAANRSTDPGQFGEWIADIERPAEQFRGRYQLRLDEADTLLKSAPDAPAAPAAAAAPAAPPSRRRRRRRRAARRSPGRRAPRRSPRSPRRRSTRARRTSGAVRRRRRASTARASSSGPTRRWASRSRG